MGMLEKAYKLLEEGEAEEALALTYVAIERAALTGSVKPELLAKARELYARYVTTGTVDESELKLLILNAKPVEGGEESEVVELRISGRDLALIAVAAVSLLALLVPIPQIIWVDAVRIPVVAALLTGLLLARITRR